MVSFIKISSHIRQMAKRKNSEAKDGKRSGLGLYVWRSSLGMSWFGSLSVLLSCQNVLALAKTCMSVAESIDVEKSGRTGTSRLYQISGSLHTHVLTGGRDGKE